MLEKIKNKLVVSCQALENEPLHSSFIMGRMAKAAEIGGAAGIRAQSKADILEIERVCSLPIIGIIKRSYPDSEVFITATKKEIQELLETSCEIIALDATRRKRPQDEQLSELVNMIHENNRLAMADCSTFDECLTAQKLGFDIVSTTLCGYTSYSLDYDGPNFELLKKCVAELEIPVIAEGKINTPEDLARVYNECGVYSAVVGGAITRPQQITARFTKVLERRK